jgi:DNA invertase Pin-like site-specific DNA recombinase
VCAVGEGQTVIGYVRVSTEDQGATGAGLDAQRGAIVAECARRGWQLARIEEDVLSAKTMKRPGLQAALAACRSGEVGGVVVAKLDRLSRSVIDFGRLLAEARQDGWNIVGLDFGLDLSTPQGKLVAQLLMSVAEWEREIIGQRTREALAVKRAQGVRLGRPRGVTDSVAKRIRAARKRGQPYAQIAARLNRDEVPTGQGGARWHASTVRAVARREA